MIRINETLCSSLVSAKMAPEVIEQKITKNLERMIWQTGATLTEKEKEYATELIVDMLNDCVGNELPSARQIAARIGYPEFWVEKIKNEYFATLADYYAQKSREEIKP